jgi:hypothetical protein
MKRILTLAAAAMLLASAAFAEDFAYSTLTPKTAKSMAMGGVFTSVPTTEFSFFGNPAVFATKKAGFLTPTVDAWAYVRPTATNIGDLLDSANNNNTLLSTVFGLMAQNGGSGGGASVGLGYAGKGLGLGVFVMTDDYIEGSSPAGAVVHSDTQAMGIVGMGVPLQLGALQLSVGGDLRPFYRIRLRDADGEAPALADLLTGSTNSVYSDAFFGAVIDLGATLQFGAFTAGLTIRDIGPSFPIATTTMAELQSILSSGNLPDTSLAVDKAVFTPAVSAGLSWAPQFKLGFVKPVLYFELQDPVGVIKQWNGIGSALNLFHTGAEATFFKVITLRGGINRGWLSAGAGIKLLFLDLNAAVFTEELGALPGDHPRSGLAIQAAFRY